MSKFGRQVRLQHEGYHTERLKLWNCTLNRMISPQILQWTVRNASSSFSPFKLRTLQLRSPCVDCRLLCSSADQTSAQVSQHSRELAHFSGQPELSLGSLIDMGFTETQAGQIYEAISSVRGGSAAKHALSTLAALFVLGLNSSSVQKVLNKCPELYFVKDTQLQQRISNLRKLGLVEGEIVTITWVEDYRWSTWWVFRGTFSLFSLHRQSSEGGGPLPKDPYCTCEVCKICGSVPEREVPVYLPADHTNPQRQPSSSTRGPGSAGVQISGQQIKLLCKVIKYI